MAKNVFELKKSSDGTIETTITSYDGVTKWEKHRKGLTDVEVIVKILQKKHYQHFPESWTLVLSRDNKSFESANFEVAVQMALRYIHERDNPSDIEIYC